MQKAVKDTKSASSYTRDVVKSFACQCTQTYSTCMSVHICMYIQRRSPVCMQLKKNALTPAPAYRWFSSHILPGVHTHVHSHTHTQLEHTWQCLLSVKQFKKKKPSPWYSNRRFLLRKRSVQHASSSVVISWRIPQYLRQEKVTGRHQRKKTE